MAKAKNHGLYKAHKTLGEIEGFKHGMHETNKVIAEILVNEIVSAKATLGKLKPMNMTPGTRNKVEALDKALFEMIDDVSTLQDRISDDLTAFLIDKDKK